MQAPMSPLIVLTHAQIVAQYNLNADEFMALLKCLDGKEKRLVGDRPGTTKPGFFRDDVEAALRVARA
jgi:hypothetical protein